MCLCWNTTPKLQNLTITIQIQQIPFLVNQTKILEIGVFRLIKKEYHQGNWQNFQSIIIIYVTMLITTAMVQRKRNYYYFFGHSSNKYQF